MCQIYIYVYIIQNELRNKTVICLFSQRRYLAIDKKGRIAQTHYKEDKEGMNKFTIFSYKHIYTFRDLM